MQMYKLENKKVETYDNHNIFEINSTPLLIYPNRSFNKRLKSYRRIEDRRPMALKKAIALIN